MFRIKDMYDFCISRTSSISVISFIPFDISCVIAPMLIKHCSANYVLCFIYQSQTIALLLNDINNIHDISPGLLQE
jgi:hypothetical protein